MKAGYDLDGVLANGKRVRNENEALNLEPTGFKIPSFCESYIISSREERLREVTEQWLLKHGFKYNGLKLLDNHKSDRNGQGRIRSDVQIEFKKKCIEELDLDFYFEDNYKVFKELRQTIDSCKICFVDMSS